MPLFGESNLRQGFSNAGVAGWHSQFSGNIPNSCSFDNDDSQYLQRTTSSHSNNEVTLACWFQHIDEADGRMRGGNIGIISIGDGSGTGTPNNGIFISAGVIYLYANGQGATTNALFGDQGWYHLIASFKLDESSGTNKGRLFVNGVEITDWNADPRSSWGTSFNNVSKQLVGLLANTTSPDGYIAQPVFLDGQSIQGGDWTVDSFLDTYAITTNRSVRTPKSNDDIKTLVDAAPSNNSAFLPFTNASAMGNDGSTHGNNFSLNNISSADQSSHTPSQVYVHWNGRANTFTGDNALGNPAAGRIDDHGTTLNADTQSSSADVTGVGDLFIDTTANSGKYYLEYQFGGGSFAGSYYVGFIGDRNADHLGDGGQQIGYQGPENTDRILFYATAGTSAAQMTYSIDGGSNVNLTLAAGGSFPRIVSASDRLGILYDFDNNEVVLYDKDGNASTAVSWTPDSPSISIHAYGNGINGTIFTDSGDWTHSVSGVKEWKSGEISAPTYNGVDYFDATIYEGNGDNQRVGDFVPFTDTFTIANSAMWTQEDIRRLRHTYSSEAAATSDNSSDSAVYRKATISFWVKFIETNDTDNQTFIATSDSGQSERFMMYAHGTDDDIFVLIDPSGSDNNRQFKFAKGLLSTQNWSNVVINLDTNNSTAADRMKIWINGNPVTNTETSRPYTAMTQGQDLFLFADEQLMIGHLPPTDTYNSNYNFNGYFAEFHVIDGYTKAPSDFGQVDTSTNRWVPKDYKTNVGTYGNRGFYLKFDGTPGAGSGSDMGKDSSGNNIHLTEETHGSGSAWAATDKVVNTPSKNFATFDVGYLGGSSNIISEGGTRVKGTDGTNSDSAVATFGMTGKVVFDFKFHTVGGGYPKVGFITGQAGLEDINAASGSIELGTSNLAGSVAFGSSGSFYIPEGPDSTTYQSTIATGQSVDADDVIRYEVDTDAGSIRVYFQNEGTGSFTEITSAAVNNFDFDSNFGIRPAVSNYNNSEVSLLTGGQTTLSSVSTGFLELNQDNLDSTASELTAFAWIKNRDAADAHILVDRLRGVGKTINSNDESIETSEPNTVQRFLQRGVQIASDVQVNTSGESYVMWQWLSGETAGTGSVTSPAGGISSNTIVSTPGNFSVGTYRGTGSANTVGHGLGGAPELIFIKNRSSGSTGTSDWVAGTQYAIFEHDGSDPWTDYGHLDTNGDFVDLNTKWNDTAPTSNVFTIGTHNRVNKANDDYVFYAFRSVPGVCKIGNYLGNHAGQPGPAAYINCGFTPRMVMVKNLSTSGDGWMVFDTARHPFNVTSALVWDATTVESSLTSYGSIDILANGFKIQASTDATSSAVRIHALNESDQVYLYLAMADIGGNGDLPPLYGR